MTKFKDVLKSQNAKTLLSNFASLSILQVVNIILPLITLPYVLRVLGTNNYGLIVMAASVVTYFHSITDYSFKLTATRDVAVSRHSPKQLNFIYSKVMTVKFSLLLISYLLLILIVYSYPPFYEERMVFFLTFPMLFGHALFPDWFFLGMEKMKFITILNILVKIFFTLGVFFFIKKTEDYWMYPLLQSLGYLGSGVIAQVLLFRNFSLRFKFLKIKQVFSTLLTNFPVFINQFLPNLYNNTTTIVLGLVVNTSAVGIYDAIKKIVDLGITLLQILSQVFFPYLNRIKAGFGKFRIIASIACICLFAIIIALSDFVFWYLNIDYKYAFAVLFILGAGLFGYSFSNIYGTNFLLVRRNDRVVMRNTVIASLLGFTMAFPLILSFGIIGASLNLTISRLTMGLLMFFTYLKFKKTKLPS